MRRQLPRNSKGNVLAQSVILWAIVAAVSTAFVFRQAQVMSTRKRLVELEREISQYTMANAALEKQIQMMQSDEYIEKIAREKLGLVRPGEVQYMMIKPESGK